MKFASRSEPHATHLKQLAKTTNLAQNIFGQQGLGNVTMTIDDFQVELRNHELLHQSHTPPPYLMSIILSCLTFSVEETRVWCPHQVAFPQNTLRREPFACF